MRRRALALTVVLTAALAGGTTAASAAPTERADVRAGGDVGRFLIASRDETGYVAIGAFGVAPGTVVRYAEVVGDREEALPTVTAGPTGAAPLPRAVTWRCDRRVRSFSAVATAPDGTVQTAATDLRTPGCASRVALTAPAHVDRRALIRVRLVDRWMLGDVTARLCTRGGGQGRVCRNVRLSRRRSGVVRRVRPDADGRVEVRLTLAGSTTATSVAVGRVKARPQRTGPLVLTTGDSTIEGIDSGLEDALGSAARIRTESAPGTRLSGTGEPDWQRRAAGQVRRLHPRVVVLSLGGNEGYPITPSAPAEPIACCGADWVTAVAVRQGRLMDRYVQKGRADVVWLTIPVPRSAAQAEIVAAVNAGVIRAARGRDHVRVLDLGAIFTPDGVFHESIRRGGRDVRVRAPDGLHLSAAGQQIAADAVAALLTRDSLLD